MRRSALFEDGDGRQLRAVRQHLVIALDEIMRVAQDDPGSPVLGQAIFAMLYRRGRSSGTRRDTSAAHVLQARLTWANDGIFSAWNDYSSMLNNPSLSYRPVGEMLLVRDVLAAGTSERKRIKLLKRFVPGTHAEWEMRMRLYQSVYALGEMARRDAYGIADRLRAAECLEDCLAAENVLTIYEAYCCLHAVVVPYTYRDRAIDFLRAHSHHATCAVAWAIVAEKVLHRLGIL